MATFDELVAEAMAAPFSGWDFSWLNARATVRRLPWDYQRVVTGQAAAAGALLDLGTGGGEILAGLASRPPRTVATEGWPPNVGAAGRRLRPLGVPVVQVAGAPDNDRQQPGGQGALPFGDGAFPLVVSRHEAFRAAEVSRVLCAGGTFVTQQVDMHTYDDLYRLAGLDLPSQPESWLPLAIRQVREAGLTVLAAVRGEETEWFHDVAAVVYYLRVVPWAMPKLSLEECLPRLRAAHQAREIWPVAVRQRRFLLIAAKPAG